MAKEKKTENQQVSIYIPADSIQKAIEAAEMLNITKNELHNRAILHYHSMLPELVKKQIEEKQARLLQISKE